ncbi:hypothetical protein N7509_005806 [Penicillium cosmopolitanum]|uniref:Uncharacterized protein n=1 Tax=Penicillium cosmopolitanum TaxID=1131564 RepID=A0A9W9W394_9EURO|nr:uncharacterized protein N7509_005806 [Penicillium cosmopolitanum]KAJ5397693.1 hypothetical protein N7509_005806 [Penicillium cosmopolitanum]
MGTVGTGANDGINDGTKDHPNDHLNVVAYWQVLFSLPTLPDTKLALYTHPLRLRFCYPNLLVNFQRRLNSLEDTFRDSGASPVPRGLNTASEVALGQ